MSAKTVSLESLLGAMQKAEMNWQADEGLASFEPLTTDEYSQLRRGEKVTVIHQYWVTVNFETHDYALKRDVYRATVTKVKRYGYAGPNGFWCSDDYVAMYGVGEMIPSWSVNYKTVEGYSNIVCTADLNRTRVYRGWEVQIENYDPSKG